MEWVDAGYVSDWLACFFLCCCLPWEVGPVCLLAVAADVQMEGGAAGTA